MTKDFRIIVLISGRGSNLKSLIESAHSYKIVGVLSNKPEAPGLLFAKEAGIPTFTFGRHDFPDIKAQKKALLDKCQELSPDLGVLAGYMQIIEPPFLAAFKNQIINIHPSLLPAHPGIDTHEKALAAKVKMHGCSVHLVDEGIDTGQLIAQAACQVIPGDDVESLSLRVLSLEHKLLPWVVNSIASGNINIKNGTPAYTALSKAEALALGFKIFD